MAKRKNWFSLFFTNYLGVLNDNFLKTLACFICIAWVGKENESMVVTLASAALVIPYLLFSPLAGRMGKVRGDVDHARGRGRVSGALDMARVGLYPSHGIAKCFIFAF